MRIVWLVFVGLLAALAVGLPLLNRPAAPGSARSPVPLTAGNSRRAAAPSSPARSAAPLQNGSGPADSVVAFGLAQRGTPYVYAGTSPRTGFDCSGFIMFTFARFGVAVPHSTALLIDVGRPVARADAQPGDIVVFTGTAASSTTPGHAGIVVSDRGEVPLRFVHASSARRESGVKVSHMEGTDYERRFLQVRRVLGPGAPAAVAQRTPGPPPTATKLALVAPLRARPVAVRPVGAPAALLPRVLPARKKVAGVAAPRKPTRPAARQTPTGRANHVAVKKKATRTKKPATPVIRRKTPAKGQKHVGR